MFTSPTIIVGVDCPAPSADAVAFAARLAPGDGPAVATAETV